MSRSGQPCSGVSGSPSASYAISACSSSSASSGTFAVKSCSACATTKRALGFGLTISASVAQLTPRKLVSKRLQRVTQWMSVVTSVAGSALSSSHESVIGFSTSPKTLKSQVARSVSGTVPACSTGHFSVRYCPGGSRAGSNPASATFCSALDLNTVPTLVRMATVTRRIAWRPRDYVRVAGTDAADFLQRMLSNDVEQAPCRAMLLTPKARLIAPVMVVRRADDDFLLLTEPGLGETVSWTLLRARFAAKVEIESEEHVSLIALGE